MSGAVQATQLDLTEFYTCQVSVENMTYNIVAIVMCVEEMDDHGTNSSCL